MNEVTSFMIYVGGFIMAIVWIVFPFTVASLLRELIREVKHVHWELRKLNNKGEAPGRPSSMELEQLLGPGPDR